MNIIKIRYPLMDANSYLLYWDGDNAVLIDAVPHSYEKVKELCKTLKKRVKAVLLTHGHIDHMVDAIKFQNDGALICIGRHDKDKLHTDKNLGKRLGIPYEPTNADRFFDTYRYYIDCHHIDAIETPGHTVGSLCYYIEGVLFTGDTLFKGTIGRTDFEDGSFNDIMNSLKKLYNKYPHNIPIYPGHGLETTLEFEKKHNPYFENL